MKSGTQRLVFFDGGGTLWNSLPLLYDSYSAAFEKAGIIPRGARGLRYSSRLCHRLRSMPACSGHKAISKILVAWQRNGVSEKMAYTRLDAYLDRWLEAGAAVSYLLNGLEETPSAETDAFDTIIADREQRIDPPFYPLCAGADGLSAAFSKREWGFCLVSNRDPSSVSVILAARGLAEWLEEGRHYLNLGEGKPKEADAATPEMKNFLAVQKVSQEHAAWVGDSVTDAIAAQKLGVRMIGLGSGMAPERDLWQAGVDVVVPDLAAAIGVLDHWVRTGRF